MAAGLSLLLIAICEGLVSGAAIDCLVGMELVCEEWFITMDGIGVDI